MFMFLCGEIFGVVGEFGLGKSVLNFVIMGLLNCNWVNIFGEVEF